MNRYKTISMAFIILFFLSFNGLFAQMGGGHGGHGGHGGNGHQGGNDCDPDSLIPVTVSGTAIVDSSMMHPMYYLDENGDGEADYHLNFGPWWYEPDSGNASRPNDGDFVTIDGGMHDDDSLMGNLPVIIVYQINGEFWRDPFDPSWTHHGGHGGGHHGGHGHTWGWMHDSLQVVTVTGTAMVDSTFIFSHYYLDENNDAVPDYYLNFGPPWYEPPSGAERPNDGDVVTIMGGLFDNNNLPMIIVYEINGQVWRDTTGWGPHMGGRWIYRYMNQASHIQAPFDDDDWMDIEPGWHPGGGGHHGHLPDSLFCQMIQIFPQNAPNSNNENVFAAYEFGLFSPGGVNILWQDHMYGRHIQFANNVDYQLHYNDIQLQGFNIDESTIQVKYWNEQSNSWEVMGNAVVDMVNNTVTITDATVSSLFILTGQQNPLSIDEQSPTLATQFTLEQNYPNPFNPSTTIEFSLQDNAHVVLTIYNVLGQKVVQLLDEAKPAGVYQVKFDAGNLPSGIYFYELKVGDVSMVKKMNLRK
ncbi:MAG: T9SS C-terminal target domain-containing protein [Calditrichaeota bacterium]|nr:MAG: T9SS C-terminal target domain-containing protein [Calditrichota bacterium]